MINLGNLGRIAVLCGASFFASSHVGASELPKRPYQTNIVFPPIGYGQVVNIVGRVGIPLMQTAKAGPPSGVEIYQRFKQGWKKTGSYPLHWDAKNKELTFNQKLELQNPKSEFAIHVTAAHCHQSGQGLCVIDHFQGIINRTNGTSNIKAQFDLKGTDPATFK